MRRENGPLDRFFLDIFALLNESSAEHVPFALTFALLAHGVRQMALSQWCLEGALALLTPSNL